MLTFDAVVLQTRMPAAQILVRTEPTASIRWAATRVAHVQPPWPATTAKDVCLCTSYVIVQQLRVDFVLW